MVEVIITVEITVVILIKSAQNIIIILIITVMNTSINLKYRGIVKNEVRSPKHQNH